MNNSFEHIALAGTYVLKNEEGFLHSIVVNTSASGIITVYDNTAASGKVIAILKSAIGEGSYIYDLKFRNGLTVKTAAASDITVSYS